MAERPATVPALFLRQAALRPDRVAFLHKQEGAWHPVTWARYAETVRHLAAALLARGVQPGDRILIHGPNSPQWLQADLASEAVGAIVVGAYPTCSAAELRDMIDDCAPVLLITAHPDMAPPGVTVLPMDALEHERQRGADLHARDRESVPARLAALRATDISCLIYTSGTTGKPKGAMLSHGSAIAGAESIAAGLGLDGDDVMLAYLPLCHLAERNLTLYVAALNGHTVYLASSPQQVQAELREVQPTFFGAVPRVAQKMRAELEAEVATGGPARRLAYRASLAAGRFALHRQWRNGYRSDALAAAARALAERLLLRRLRGTLGLSRVRHCIIGTAPVPPALMEYLHAIGLPFQQSYGQTEAGGATHLSRLDRFRTDAIGPAAPGYEHRLGEGGEILVRGPALFSGYWNAADATAATLRDGWLHTGDIGELTGDDQLRISGRIKDIIITAGGKNIAPAVIESMLRASPFIREAVVVGEGQRFLTALIGLEPASVNAWLRARGLPEGSLAELCGRDEVVALVDAEVQRVNADLARVETIKRFRLLPRELDVAQGELTVTQKVRRQAVIAGHAALVAEMYA